MGIRPWLRRLFGRPEPLNIEEFVEVERPGGNDDGWYDRAANNLFETSVFDYDDPEGPVMKPWWCSRFLHMDLDEHYTPLMVDALNERFERMTHLERVAHEHAMERNFRAIMNRERLTEREETGLGWPEVGLDVKERLTGSAWTIWPDDKPY